MSNYSLFKCAAALTTIMLYTFMFGFIKDIDSVDPATPGVDQSPEFHDSRDDKDNADRLYGEPIIAYKTTIKAENDQKPALSDYPAATSAPPADTNETTEVPRVSEAPTVIITDAPETTAPRFSDPESVTKPAAPSTAGQATTSAAAVTKASTTVYELEEIEEEELEELIEITQATTQTATIANKALRSRADSNEEQLYVVYNGKEITDSALNIVSRMVQCEIGSAFNTEAIKAQAVASYTYVKQYNEYHDTPAPVLMANVASGRVTSTVNEVLGQAIYYNGEYIQAVYCSSTAGYTASAKNVWGTDLPYLRSINTPNDKTYDSNYGVTKKFSSTDIMKKVLETTGISLTGDPANWFQILSLVDNVYVGNMSVGGKTTFRKDGADVEINGRTFREQIMDYDIKSSCFEIDYSKTSDMFTFTTYGYGHGVGMSQNGANTLAKVYGYDYIKILGYYYPGTEVK